jgi:hypothetical protein
MSLVASKGSPPLSSTHSRARGSSHAGFTWCFRQNVTSIARNQYLCKRRREARNARPSEDRRRLKNFADKRGPGHGREQADRPAPEQGEKRHSPGSI